MIMKNIFFPVDVVFAPPAWIGAGNAILVGAAIGAQMTIFTIS
jgi:hypothetical protein